MEKIENDEKYFVAGRRRLKVIEIYGDKPIDEILPDFIKYILSKEVNDERTRS